MAGLAWHRETSERAARLPGYRRRIRIVPREGAVLAMLEDDIHCMAVRLRHDGTTVTSVEPEVDRMPWNICPGAQAKLVETFSGLPLAEVTARREKRANCTHLHDLAVLAAAHAGARGGLLYEIYASDPVEGERLLAIRRDGVPLHEWVEQDGTLVLPDAVAGRTLPELREWINALDEPLREAARLLQWGALVAHGRILPIEQQSNAAALPPNCFTFQPERAVDAVRNGARLDFSDGTRVPLAGFGDRLAADLT